MANVRIKIRPEARIALPTSAMTSEHRVPSVVGESVSNVGEGVSSGAGAQPSTLIITPERQSKDPFSSREGSVHRDGSLPSQPTEPLPQRLHIPSPSDLEHGMGGYSEPRPELNPIDTRNQGLESGHPLPNPPSAIRRQTNESDLRPRGNPSPRSQRSDPFAHHDSPNGSQRSNSNHPRPSSRGREEVLSQSISSSRSPMAENHPTVQLGGHILHALEDEGTRFLRRLQGQQTTDPNNGNGVGARLKLALEEDRDDIVGQIPGAYQHDAAGLNLPSLPGRVLQHGEELSGTRRNRAGDPIRYPSRSHSVIDHIVPVAHISEFGSEKEQYKSGSVSARLHATVKQAEEERDKYASKAKFTGLALNIAIGLQVLLGSLTTGLSAVATQGKSSAVSTTILGALATVVASYLARARGSNEPELSITRVKDLEQFIRESKNFQTDHGDDMGHDYDSQIEAFRMRFESLLGNANGERKLSSAGVHSHHVS